MKVIFFIYFLLIGVLSAQPSNQFGQNYHIIPLENIDQKFPYGVFDLDGIFHLVWVNDNNGHKDVYYARSTDEGYSFSDPVRLNSHINTVVAYTQSGPKIVIRGEELIVVFMDDRTGYTSTYINVSIDGGSNWGEDVRVSDQMYLTGYPEIEVGIDGKIHLFYYSYNQNYSFNSVRYTVAQEGSFEFTPSQPVGITNEEMEPCDCCQPDLEISENGDLYLAYRNNISNQRKHFLVKKSFNSDNFEEPSQISDYNDFISYCPSSGPSISIDGNNIGAGFYVSQHNNSYVNHSDLSTLLFTSEVNVNPSSGASQNFPFTLLKGSILHATWVDYRNGNPDIYYASMGFDSEEVTNEQRISDDPIESSNVQKDPFLIWNDDNLLCFWSDNRTGDYQIFMTRTGGTQSETITIPLDSDWNLVALPLIVDDASYELLFPNAVDGTLYSFSDGYELGSQLEMGKGYWLRFFEPGITQITGTPIDTLVVDVLEGWNLISGIHTEISIIEVNDPGDIIISGTIYQFDEGYIMAELFQPGKGYWIRSNSNGVIYFIEL